MILPEVRVFFFVKKGLIPCVARLGTRGLGCKWHLAFLRKVAIPHIERPLRPVNGLGSTSGLNTSDKRDFARGQSFFVKKGLISVTKHAIFEPKKFPGFVLTVR